MDTAPSTHGRPDRHRSSPRPRARGGENARFVAERPRSMALLERARGSMPRGVPMAWMDDLYEHPPVWVAHGDGAGFTDVDGHTYLDMYVADMSAFCGHAPAPVVDAVAERMRARQPVPAARRGRDRRRRAPRRALRAAEVAVHPLGHPGEHRGDPAGARADGREIVLMFDGKYHGEGDATLRDRGGRAGGSREPGPAPGHRRPGAHRPVQRRRRARGRARARRRGASCSPSPR